MIEKSSKNNSSKALIYGKAGIGKTTFCKYIAYRWAKGELYSEFDNIVYIALREWKSDGLESIVKKIYFEEKHKDKAIEIDQSKTLFLFDGYDELSDTSLLHGAISKYTIQNYIITSRPYGYRKSDFDVNEVFETIGFTDENVTAYIDKFFEEQSHKINLQNFLKQNINIKHIAYIPLMLEMICSLWREKVKSNQSFLSPMTMTELYDIIVENTSKKYCINKNDMWVKKIEDYTGYYLLNNSTFSTDIDTDSIKNEVLRFPKISNGAIYDNRFIIKSFLGRGGFADIYLVTDKYNNYQEMLLKLFKYENQSESIKSYIEREAKFLKKIFSVDGIVKIIEVSWVANRRGLIILQEYIKGISLEDYLYKEDFLKENEAINIIISLCETLEKLHNLGVIHADIKPSNILLDENKMKPILIDFGNARYIGEKREKNITFSFPYTPPEIFSASTVIDAKIDIYSLGVTLLELLVGLKLKKNKPFYNSGTMMLKNSENKSNFYQFLNKEEKEKKFLEIQNNKLKTILRKMLESSKNRYSSINDLLYDLNNYTL